MTGCWEGDVAEWWGGLCRYSSLTAQHRSMLADYLRLIRPLAPQGELLDECSLKRMLGEYCERRFPGCH